jgi:hypothetical protein
VWKLARDAGVPGRCQRILVVERRELHADQDVAVGELVQRSLSIPDSTWPFPVLRTR